MPKETKQPTSPPIDANSATYQSLFRVVSDTTNTVAIIDANGRVEWVNRAFEELTGYPASEAVGLPFETFLIANDSDPEWGSRMRQMMSDGKAVSGERIHRRRDGKEHWCAFNISPLHQADGKLAGWVDIGWDTTAARKARDQLQRASQHAEAVSRAKSEFLANMSHEIRTPMNTIVGMTELALRTSLTEQQSKYLNAVKDSAHSLLEILNDVLDISKIESGKMELDEVDFNLLELFQETMGPAAVQAEAKGLKLGWHLAAETPTNLRGDPTRLRQILLNLASNAIKFTENGEIAISVEKQWSGGGEIGLQLSVRDTGIGIPPDRLSTIFEAFTQVDSSTTRQYGGTGLGLAITARLLRMMHGRVWVDSTVGQGSTFFCTLRLREGTGEDANLAGPMKQDAIHASDQPVNVLIADDHPPNRELLGEILGQKGHSFTEAANGQEVLERLEREKFDVVLMDVQMPEMDGLEATAIIRAAELRTRDHQPIVAVTAHAMKGDRERCLAAGMDAYLSKPINSRELLALVASLARGASVPPADSPELSDGRRDRETKRQAAGFGLDFAAALERLAGDEELLKRQMRFFLSEVPSLLHELRTSLDEGDAESLKIAVHRLKGLAASYDATHAAELASQLETRGIAGDLDDVDTIAEELQTSIDDLRIAIEAYLG